MGDILKNLEGTQPDPDMRLADVSYLSPGGKKGLGVIGDVMLVDSTGTEVDMSKIGSSSGSGAGGGSIVYTNAAKDFDATITNGTKNITITGLPFTLEDVNVVAGSIKKISSTGTITPLTPTGLSVAGGVITLVGVDNFVTGDKVLVTLIGPDKAYDRTLDIQKVVETNPEYGRYTSVETLVSETNVGATGAADADSTATNLEKDNAGWSNAIVAIGYKAYNITESTNATISSCDTDTIVTGAGITSWAADTYAIPIVKRFEIPMEGYQFCTLQYTITAGANNTCYMKIFGTLDATATADDDTAWIDMSATYLGGAGGLTVAVGTSASAFIRLGSTDYPILKYMVKIVGEPRVAAISNAFTVLIKKGY